MAPAGSPDYCAAISHFLKAFQLANVGGVTQNGNCAPLSGTSGLGTINLYVSSENPVFGNLADALAGPGGAIDSVMGRKGTVNECALSFQDLSDFIFPPIFSPNPKPGTSPEAVSFACPPISQGNWHMIASDWGMSSFVDQFYWFYNSRPSSANACTNPFHYCRADYDRWSNMVEFNDTYSSSLTSAQAAEYVLGSTVGDIPLFSLNEPFAYLDGWNRGVVNQVNAGIFNSWTALNAWRSNPAVPGTIRWGFSESLFKLNPFMSETPWEIFILGEIYDSLLAVNPMTKGDNTQVINWITTGNSDSFDSSKGTTTQTWNLRNDIFFQDGQRVSPDDVCFSILAYRDVPSVAFQSNVANVVSCSTSGQNIVQVVLKGRSPGFSGSVDTLFDLSIGQLPIIPHHVWASYCSWPVGSPEPSIQTLSVSQCASVTFDPVLTGIMVGSGPWFCNSSVGVSSISGQTSCTQNANGSQAGQVVTTGGRVLLRRYVGYVRCCDNLQVATNVVSTSNLQALEWSDGNKDGKVTILDMSSIANAYGTQNPYWAHPIYGVSPGTVDVGDVSTVSYYIDDGITFPFLGSPTGPHTSTPPQLTGIDTLTDPFRADLGGGTIAYYFGVTSYSSGGTTAQIGVVTGTASPSAFTAQVGSSSATGIAGAVQGRVVFNLGPVATTSCSTIIISYLSSQIFTMAFGNCG